MNPDTIPTSPTPSSADGSAADPTTSTPTARDAAGAAVRDAESSPFGTVRGRRRLLFGAAGGAVLVGAALAAWLATREAGDVRSAGGREHDHAAMAASGTDVAQPVMLSGAQAERIGVTYAPATVGTLAREIRTVGQVTYDETRMTTVSPKIDGWVERLYVDFTGQPVRAGDPLFSIYSPMLVSAQEELLLAKRLAGEVAGGTSEARRNAEELLASARRRLAYWDVPADEIARIERTRQVERTLTLRSPVHGVVVEKNVLAGQRIMSGDALYKVADLGTVWVEGEVYEQDLRAVRLGLPVTATLEAYPGEEWQGRIAYVYPTVNPDTRTARVRVALANPGLRLKPGMFATLRFHGVAREGVLTVPRTAVLSTGERSIVFVKRPDGMLEPHLVQVGAQTGDRTEIVRGLAATDTVVSSATFLVDAESNLGTLMGGMGNMPGMDMTKPVDETTAAPAQAPTDAGRRR
jgi:Cu(I)/Ag(I) efflux system membrane fusion protein